MTLGVWLAIAGVAIAALTLIFSAIKDMRHNASESGKTSVILGGINDKLSDINKRQERYEGKQEGYMERLVAVEQSEKSAHHRIDDHEVRIVNLEKSN